MRIYSFAAVAACTALMALPAHGQTAQPDLDLYDMSDLGGPRPNGQIRASIQWSGSSATVTPDLVVYRGSVAAGGAAEILRKALTLAPGYTGYDSGAVIPFNEGEVYSVCINPAHSVSESNFNNNCRERVVSTGYTDLAINVADISMTPIGPSVGQPVTVNVKVRNKYDTAAKTLVRLFQSHPESPGSKLLGQNTINIPGKGSAVASFTFSRPAGDSNLWVQLEDVYPRDIGSTDNLTSRNVYLKAIINTGRTAPGSTVPVPYASSPAIGDLMGTGQPVMVFAEYVGAGTVNAEARITALQIFSDGTSRELWSKSGFLPKAADALAPAMADIDGDGQPEIIFEAVSRKPDNSGGQIGVFVLNKDGSLKWQHVWDTVGRLPCHVFVSDSKPAIGDMNGDKIADIVVLEADLVVLDGRNGNELQRKPGLKNRCSNAGYSAIADLDGDGKNDYIVGDFGIHVFNSDGTLRWENTTYGNIYAFALLDTDKDGKPEIVMPIHRSSFVVFDAVSGQVKALKKPSPDWGAFSQTIAATNSVDPNNLPSLAIANNDYKNGTGLLDNNLNLKWYDPVPPAKLGYLDNPSYVVLADLLGQGRPQVISHSTYRNIGLQDILTGQWLEYFSITGGFLGYNSSPIPVDVDGDGRGEVIVSYSLRWTYQGSYEPKYPEADFLVFGSDQWKKIPSTWNQHFFVPNQVDQKLAFKHDYQPWKTHNSWMQQPLRKPCDIEFDDDVDQNDINAIVIARGQTVQSGDWRDYDKDGVITVNDARACTQRCTLANCGVINPGGQILSVSPRRAFPGSTVKVAIRAEFMKFKTGQVTVNFGSGVTVANLTVLDADNLTATVTIAANQTGERSVSITSGGVTVSRPSAFSLSAGNLPPVVEASPGQSVVLPGSISISGTVTDDGLPFNQLGYSWQMVGGPGQVTIANPNSLTTTVSFSKEGFYTLRLAASDGEYFSHDDIGIVAIQGNQAPFVSAGQPITVQQDAASITLNGNVQDDGLPYGSKVNSQWTKTSGPGTVTFSAPTSPVSGVAFSAPGPYVLTLTASDSQLSGNASVAITVNPPTPRILSVSPASGAPGQTRTVTVVGKYTNFVQGSTTANFGLGVSVGGAAAGAFGPVTVVDATTATAQITIASGATLGARTVTIVTGSELAAKDKAFIVGAIGVPFTVQPNLSYRAISPGESVTASPQVFDAAGNIISGTASFTMTVTPKPGLTLGNAPVVNGLTATFPKLQKRLINQNPTLDPEGKYADGDPADPNYGKETGGIYNVDITLNGSAVKGSAELVVLPAGSAQITLNTLRFVTDLGPLLDAARLAAASGDATAISSAKGALAALSQNPDYKPVLLATNNVLAPVDGFPVTYSQVAARFPAAPDDANFTSSIDAMVRQLQLIRARIDGISAVTRSPADLDALTAGAATYKSMVAQLGALKPSPRGVVASTEQLNQLLTRELPLLLASINRKTTELIAVIPVTSTLKPMSAKEEFHQVSTDPKDFFDEAWKIFKDLGGYATENIIELAASLANSLINIAAASAINSRSEGDLEIDFVAAGSQFSFACPNYPNTYVEATGLSPLLLQNSVAVIGCINSQALRDLTSLKPVKSLKSAIKLFQDIKKLVDAMELDKIAAIAAPNELRPGLFEGTQMVFNEGWPRVNRSRLPCVGIVIAFNLESGALHAVNVNMLPECQ